MADPRVWLIGENNPYGADPRYALFDDPPHSAGGRLRRLVLGMKRTDYFRSFERRNLLQAPRWSVPAARQAANVLGHQLQLEMDRGLALAILFGKRVFDAFEYWGFMPLAGAERKWTPFTIAGKYLILPHPSGLSRAWNDPESFSRARRYVAEFAPHLAPMLGCWRVRDDD